MIDPARALWQILGPKKKHDNDYYITVSVTVVVRITVPEVAVTVME
jgi:hypothetical protein